MAAAVKAAEPLVRLELGIERAEVCGVLRVQLQQAEARRVRQVPARLQRHELRLARGVAAALDAADGAGLLPEARAEDVHQRGLAHGRLPGKGDDAPGGQRHQLRHALAGPGVGQQHRAVRAAVLPGDAAGGVQGKVRLVDDERGLDPGLARAQEQAVRQKQVRLRGRGRDRDEEQVDIGHRRAQQLAGPGQDLLEEALLLRGAGRREEHLVPDHGADALLTEAPARAADIELPFALHRVEAADSL